MAELVSAAMFGGTLVALLASWDVIIKIAAIRRGRKHGRR